MLAQAAKQPEPTPAVLAYRAVQQHRDLGPRGEEGLDLHITTMLERGGLREDERAILEALLRRHEANGGKDNPPLSVVFQRYHEQRKLTPKSRMEFDAVQSRFIKAIGGDLPVRSLTPAHIRTFRTVLQATPSTHRKGEMLSPGTVLKTINVLKAVLSWARSEDFLDNNPAERIGVMKRDHNEAQERRPYSAEDLAKLFSPEAIARRAAGKRPSDLWLPWLGLYTGARLNELGQLHVGDVRREDGVDYLAIEPGEGKRVKTRSSRRLVPVHPELVRLGFLRFVEDQRAAGQTRLFSDLKPSKVRSITTAWSQRWARHAREDCGIADRTKVFHSFRHGWKDAARGAMPEEHHDAITGHSNGSVGRGYGTGVPLKVLAESMAKVKFTGLR
jgi:integrase